MRLLALVKNVNHVCCRYRLAAFRSHLAQAGHDLEFQEWPTYWFGRLLVHRQLRHADAVIVQRRLLSAFQLGLIRRQARRLIFDFDDAVFLRDSYSGSGQFCGKRLRGFQRMVQAADVVVAGNSFLANRATEITEDNRARIVPTCVDPTRYPVAEHRRSGEGVCLAWIGSSSTLQGLERTASLWDDIGQRCSGVMLKLICDKTLSLGHLPVEFCRWSEAGEGADLAAADIGVSWLPDDPWSAGKCGLKILQYMAAGLPVVANPVGVQPEMIRHGETGFLVETPAQWCDAIARLAADPNVRRRMGQEGRRQVEAKYSVAAGAAQWIRLLNDLQAASQLEAAA